MQTERDYEALEMLELCANSAWCYDRIIFKQSIFPCHVQFKTYEGVTDYAGLCQ